MKKESSICSKGGFKSGGEMSLQRGIRGNRLEEGTALKIILGERTTFECLDS